MGGEFSQFSLWISRNLLCPFIGHRWEFWQNIQRSKCERCLISKGDSIKDTWLNGFAVRVAEYRKLQIPYWKLMGQKATSEEAAQERYMKRRGMDYYDVQKENEFGRETYSKNMRNLVEPPKAQKVEYKKVRMPK